MNNEDNFDISKSSPEEIFQHFDDDGSGLINFTEFKDMLPQLGIQLSDAKSLKYFRMCDTDDSGAIDLEEFKMALFVCDPESGNPMDFSPSNLLTPADAFQMFDEDNSGTIDINEFTFLIDYMNIEMDDMKVEKIFKRYDKDNNNELNYNEFKRAWLEMVDLRKELENRGIEVSRFTTKKKMIKLLLKSIDEEERKEKMVMKQAKLWNKRKEEVIEKKKKVKQAKIFAIKELISSIDAGGQVYVFGSGTNEQFSNSIYTKNEQDSPYYEKIRDYWLYRIHEDDHFILNDENEIIQDEENENNEEIKENNNDNNNNNKIKRFKDINVQMNTCTLWGKRTVQCTVSDSIIYARTDLGEVYAWGGNNHWWFDLENDEYRGDTTYRSQLLLTTLEYPNEPKKLLENIKEEEKKIEYLEMEQKKLDEIEKKKNELKEEGKNEEEIDYIINELYSNISNNINNNNNNNDNDNISLDTHDKNEIKEGNELKLRAERLNKKLNKLNQINQNTITKKQKLRNEKEKKKLINKIKEATILKAQKLKRNLKKRNIIKPIDELSLEETILKEEKELYEHEENEKYSIICKYYGVYRAPPGSKIRLQYIKKELIPLIPIRSLKFSLSCRGKYIGEKTKIELIHEVYESLLLERDLLGEKIHHNIREMEMEIKELRKRNKIKISNQIKDEIIKLWEPLREVEAERNIKRKEEEAKNDIKLYELEEEKYNNWVKNMESLRNNNDILWTPRGDNISIELGTITNRGRLDNNDIIGTIGNSITYISAGRHHACLIHKNGSLYSWGVGNSGRLGQNKKYYNKNNNYNNNNLFNNNKNNNINSLDISKPTIIESLRGHPIRMVSCGFSHNLAISIDGQLYVWGSASNGQLGLGPIGKEASYCPIPTYLNINNVNKIINISCGSSHSGCIDDNGKLYMWGCGDGGRLGLGKNNLSIKYRPTYIEQFQSKNVINISCGNSHTLIIVEKERDEKERLINEAFEDENKSKPKGELYVAGPANLIGKFSPKFTHIPVINLQNEEQSVEKISAGFSHSAVITDHGELYTWGHNSSGCLGHPIQYSFLSKPKLVKCLYEHPTNIAKLQKSRQSSIYQHLESWIALNGDTNGNGLKNCTSTHIDQNAWWEVDLGAECYISSIRLWNRSDIPKDNTLPIDYYTKRLFPCWIMISLEPFPIDLGLESLNQSINQSVAKIRLTSNKLLSIWNTPHDITARYVRVQLENTEMLNIAQVEVLGRRGNRILRPVNSVECGRSVTVAINNPYNDPIDVDIAYKRAISVDPWNAEILKYFETFIPFYQKHKRGENFRGCTVCGGKELCDVCLLKNRWKEEVDEFPLGPGGRRRRLSSLGKYIINFIEPLTLKAEKELNN